MSSYLRQHGTRVTPQSEKARPDQVLNEAGGYVFDADKWTKLRRFLILGSEGGAYYASEKELTTKNVASLRECLAEDGQRFVDLVVEISEGGRAPSNDPALFALACAISSTDKATRLAAAKALPKVARIGTHLYHFVAYAETMRGWGKLLRRAVAEWYTSKEADQLAYQAIKYRQRDGWSHRDMLRSSHAVPTSDEQRAVFAFISGNVAHENSSFTTKGGDVLPARATTKLDPSEISIPLIEGFLAAQNSESPAATAELVRKYKLPREALKTEHLNSKAVWEAMLWEGGKHGMPITALVRNLGTMTRNDVFTSKENRDKATEILTAQKLIQHARVHPLALLVALRTYAAGRGFRGQNTWNPLPQIIDALDESFYLAFDNVEPTNQRTLLAVDCSGSMTSGQVAGSPLTPREAGVAMALVTLHAEPDVEVIAFDSDVYPSNLSRRQRLDDALRSFPNTGRGTDCSLPMQFATNNNGKVDAFIQYTDSQSWYGPKHTFQALEQYRQRSGIQACSVEVVMVAYGGTLNPPTDPRTLSVVGFDTAAPALISEFVAGRL